MIWWKSFVNEWFTVSQSNSVIFGLLKLLAKLTEDYLTSFKQKVLLIAWDEESEKTINLKRQFDNHCV